jgi:hypothetical protein
MRQSLFTERALQIMLLFACSINTKRAKMKLNVRHLVICTIILLCAALSGSSVGIGSMRMSQTIPPNTTVIDQSFTLPTNAGASINECCRFIAQTFTAGVTGTLAGVNLDVGSSSSFPLHVAIRTVTASGTPSPTILGETTLDSSSAPLSQLITFPQTINLIVGVQYAIVVNYEGAPPPGPFQFQGIWSGTAGDLYTGGRISASLSDGISWFQDPVTDTDLHFQTYVTVATEVAIDIKPQSCPNPLNTNSSGVLPVAILGANSFDVTKVDVSTIKLAGVSPLRSDLEDVASSFSPITGKKDCNSDCTTAGPDGFLDLTLKFDAQAIVAALGNVQDGQCVVVMLTGNLMQVAGGTPIKGEDVVVIRRK